MVISSVREVNISHIQTFLRFASKSNSFIKFNKPFATVGHALAHNLFIVFVYITVYANNNFKIKWYGKRGK